VTATVGFRKLVDDALQPIRQIWLGMHFIYGCFEGTVRALFLIAQLRWRMRSHQKRQGFECKGED
jgi:hypothetical protein